MLSIISAYLYDEADMPLAVSILSDAKYAGIIQELFDFLDIVCLPTSKLRKYKAATVFKNKKTATKFFSELVKNYIITWADDGSMRVGPAVGLGEKEIRNLIFRNIKDGRILYPYNEVFNGSFYMSNTDLLSTDGLPSVITGFLTFYNVSVNSLGPIRQAAGMNLTSTNISEIPADFVMGDTLRLSCNKITSLDELDISNVTTLHILEPGLSGFPNFRNVPEKSLHSAAIGYMSLSHLPVLFNECNEIKLFSCRTVKTQDLCVDTTDAPKEKKRGCRGGWHVYGTTKIIFDSCDVDGFDLIGNHPQTLIFNKCKINSLDGFQLERKNLNFRNCQIESLENLPNKMEKLEFSNCNLKKFDCENLLLKKMVVSDCHIHIGNFAGMEKITITESIEFINSGLSNFKNFPTVVGAESVVIERHNIPDLQGLHVEARLLDISNNHIKSLAGGVVDVQVLKASDNELTDTRNNFRFQKNPKIYLDHNKIENVSNLPNIVQALDLSHNQLVDVSGFPAQVNGTLDLRCNRIKNIDGLPFCKGSVLLKNNNIKVVKNLKLGVHRKNKRVYDFSNNEIEEFDFPEVGMCIISLDNNRLRSFKTQEKHIYMLTIRNNNLPTLDFLNGCKIYVLKSYDNPLQDARLTDFVCHSILTDDKSVFKMEWISESRINLLLKNPAPVSGCFYKNFYDADRIAWLGIESSAFGAQWESDYDLYYVKKV